MMIVKDKISIDTVRSKDENGYLHVAVSNITKEQVAPYYGSSIPGWQELGLDPEKIYQIYRPGEEIEKAAPTFNGLPLAFEHHDMDADNIPKEYIVGSMGTDARFEAPYLKNSLTVIDAGAIKAIEDGSCSEISAGYMCDVVMSGGVFDGISYDGRMVDIRGNHVAIVPQGRAGHDVKVADAALEEGGAKVEGNLLTKLKDLLAELLKADTEKHEGEEMQVDEQEAPAPERSEEVEAEVINPVAETEDEEAPAAEATEEVPDSEKVPEEAADEETPLEGLTEEIKAKMAEADLDPEDKAQQKAFLAGMAANKVADTCKDAAEDVARYKAMIKAADEVAPIIGKVNDPLGFNDAADIYAKALVHEGIALDGIDRSAYSAMVAMINRQPKQAEAQVSAINQKLMSIKSI